MDNIRNRVCVIILTIFSFRIFYHYQTLLGQELFEIKDDEEQKSKLQDICDLLLAAGYFRVRLKGISAFDKVIDHSLRKSIHFSKHQSIFRWLVASFGAWK